ncbi:hypothetical protein GCM10023191_007090 [Actinoallomurus oryzae]|uniref:Uncharacterized protein n=1 Tax=Actinoallomurus oryzae TaxID=502180 RepID=A0ABP8PBZ9_9ACTN
MFDALSLGGEQLNEFGWGGWGLCTGARGRTVRGVDGHVATPHAFRAGPRDHRSRPWLRAAHPADLGEYGRRITVIVADTSK